MNTSQTHCPGETADQSTARRRRAFTLVELSVAVAVVTVVSSILLPALQPLREEYNRDQAEILIGMLRLSALDYRAHFGEDADTLQQILAFDPPPFALTLQDDDIALAAGYKFRYVKLDTTFEFLAAPGWSGITGSVDLLMRADGELLEFPTDGADAGREALLRTARLEGLESIATLLFSEASSEEEALEIVTTVQDPIVVIPTANTLDANDDGVIAPGEISDHTSFPLVNVLLLDLSHTMKYGAFGEDTDALPGVNINDLTGNPGDLFSYFSVGELVGKYYFNKGLANSLTKNLTAAQSAYARGNDRVGDQQLSAFQREISAHSGKLISDDEADILKFYAEALKVSEDE